MPLGLGNDRKLHLGPALAVLLSAGLLAVGCLSPAAAHEHEEMCGPVIDADGEAVRQSDGDILMHSGSFPCPPEEATVEPVAVEPVSGVVFFDFDIDVPNSEGEAALQEIIADLRDRAPDRVNVGGHADRAGTEAYNQGLSQRRADNVAKRLIAGGIEASTVTIEAFGETQPAVPTDDGMREPANRRVEIDTAF
jgi:outer membrane protein OmpA-like peptidoglycan-associated protein